VKYWEIIADNLSKAGWSWGCVSALGCAGRTICIADAHRGDGKPQNPPNPAAFIADIAVSVSIDYDVINRP
jgi:hypothetical protein